MYITTSLVVTFPTTEQLTGTVLNCFLSETQVRQAFSHRKFQRRRCIMMRGTLSEALKQTRCWLVMYLNVVLQARLDVPTYVLQCYKQRRRLLLLLSGSQHTMTMHTDCHALSATPERRRDTMPCLKVSVCLAVFPLRNTQSTQWSRCRLLHWIFTARRCCKASCMSVCSHIALVPSSSSFNLNDIETMSTRHQFSCTKVVRGFSYQIPSAKFIWDQR